MRRICGFICWTIANTEDPCSSSVLKYVTQNWNESQVPVLPPSLSDKIYCRKERGDLSLSLSLSLPPFSLSFSVSLDHIQRFPPWPLSPVERATSFKVSRVVKAFRGKKNVMVVLPLISSYEPGAGAGLMLEGQCLHIKGPANTFLFNIFNILPPWTETNWIKKDYTVKLWPSHACVWGIRAGGATKTS